MRRRAVAFAGVVLLTACNPAIARVRGEVVTVNSNGDETEICIKNASDAGSTYGDKSVADKECLSGIVSGRLPAPGDCVQLQVQGEGSELKVSGTNDC